MPLISDELFQQLVGASYRLATLRQREDASENAAAVNIFEALRHIEQELGVETVPADFTGNPPGPDQGFPAHMPETRLYHSLDHVEVNNLFCKHLGIRGYNCAEEGGWDSDHIEFISADLNTYQEKDRQKLNQCLTDPSYYGIPLSLALCELVYRKLLPEGDYMIWVV